MRIFKSILFFMILSYCVLDAQVVECEQSNLRNGTIDHSITASELNSWKTANDILVQPGSDFNLKSITTNLISTSPITKVTKMTILSDSEAHLPEEILHIQEDIALTGLTQIGEWNNFNVYNVSFDITPYLLESDLTEEKRYWVQLEFQNAENFNMLHIETSTDSMQGLPIAVKKSSGWSYVLTVPANLPVDGVITFFGDCHVTNQNLSCEDILVPSNNFENSLEIAGNTQQRLAVDIPVGDNGFTLYGFNPNIVETATYFNFIIYEDNNGLPGNEVVNKTGQIVNEQFLGFNSSAYPMYNYEVAFDTPIDLEANTTYWIEMQTDALAWELNTTVSIGNSDAFYNSTTEGEWFDSGYHLVFSLMCEEPQMAVNDFLQTDFSYYPNPVKDELNFKSNKEVQSIEIYTMAGNKVKKLDLGSKDGKVSTSELPVGVYVFKSILKNGEFETFKVIKK